MSEAGTMSAETRYCTKCAARIVRAPHSTVRAWAIGQGNFDPLIEVDHPGTGRPISLRNLVELHMIAGLRRKPTVRKGQRRRGEISGRQLRRGIEALRKADWLSHEERAHPLLVKGLAIENAKLQVIREGRRYQVPEDAQRELDLPFMVDEIERRVVWNEEGTPEAMYPRTRTLGLEAKYTQEGEADRGIPERGVEVRHGFSGGAPRLTECGRLTWIVVDRLANGDSPLEISEDLDCTPAEIQEAAWFGQSEREDPMRQVLQFV